MRTLAACILTAALASGCFVTSQPRPYRSRAGQAVVVQERPACHPSQYWDGSTCRHKGNGWGARKHDGR